MNASNNTIESIIDSRIELALKSLRPKQKWFTPTEAAEHLRVSPKTLEAYRTTREGPRYEKQGRIVRYYITHLDDWLTRGVTQ